MKMEANYTLLVPAISEIEAIVLADEKAIPFLQISDIERDVVQVAEMEPM
jgi:hypothetical protein